MRKKLFLKKTQNLTHYLLFLQKNVFDDDLPEIKRFVGKTNPMSFTKNWYSKPTPPNMQFEERSFQTQYSVSVDKLYEWNIDGLSEQEIIKLNGSYVYGWYCLYE